MFGLLSLTVAFPLLGFRIRVEQLPLFVLFLWLFRLEFRQWPSPLMALLSVEDSGVDIPAGAPRRRAPDP